MRIPITVYILCLSAFTAALEGDEGYRLPLPAKPRSGPIECAGNRDVELANRHIRSRLEPVIGQVAEGRSLHDSLDESGTVLDIVIEMTRVGEETGALDAMLTNASDFIDEEVEVAMERVLSLVEPLLMVFMGLIVALLLVSIYLPLFSVLGQLQT